MGLNDTPSANRLHIGFFGRRNAGKSSVVNAVTNQDISVVSSIKGTTTDPVYKSMELLPLGPVMIIDTPGFDDEGSLGELRIKRTKQVLNKTDIAILVVDVLEGKKECDEELIALFQAKEIPYLVVYNKMDLLSEEEKQKRFTKSLSNELNLDQYVSAVTKEGIYELKECIGKKTAVYEEGKVLVRDIVSPSDFIVLVVPIDSAAPKGRLILPQQQTIRDILEGDATSIVVKESGLKETLSGLKQKPALVITDSQAFEEVAKVTPEDIKLTSFSILMARYKGFLREAVQGVNAIGRLKDGDTILISEGCTHHRQCNDIGTVKLPRWLKQFTKKDINIETSSGTGFPEDLTKYALILHCGGCMLTEREVRYRMKCAVDQNIPFTNYGIAIAYMKGILKRSLEVFPDILSLIEINK